MERRGSLTGKVGAIVDERRSTAGSLDRRARDASARVDEQRAEIKRLSQLVGTARRTGDAGQAEELAERSRSLTDSLKSFEADRLDETRLNCVRPAPADAEPARARRPRRRIRGGQQGRARGGVRPRRLRRAPARPPLGDRRRPRHLGSRAGGPDQRLDVRDAPRRRGHTGAGVVPVGSRPERRRLRRDPTADRRSHRHDDLDRASAQVRRRGVPHRARRPLADPDR